MTERVKQLLDEEDKEIVKIYPVPKTNPRFIMITTEM